MTISIDGGILAGGLARRMGGQNKGLAVYNSKPMIASIANALAPHVRQLLINCNRDSAAFSQFCDQTVPDGIKGFQGPLAGIHALLTASDANYVLISSCDTPLLDERYARVMLEALNNAALQPSLVYYANCNGKTHPTHILASTTLSESLGERIEQKRLRALEWLTDMAAVPVTFDDETLFYNVNTLDDFPPL